jgi:TPP-dependent pyruvate/acetoin dehydrogenase alpha subunit
LQHCGPETDDHLNYRDQKDVNKSIENCSIKKMDSLLKKIDLNWISYKKNEENKIRSSVEDSFAYAIESNLPDKEQAWENIYV